MGARPLRPRGLASILALALGAAAPGCKGGNPVPPKDEPADTEEGAGEGEGAAEGVAVVDEDGRIEPDPEQIAAGVPYLRFRIDVSDSPSRGPADAPVTIVMFSDFECPYCDEALATVASVEAEYAGQIRFVYKAMPLNTHPNALTAALIGHSARAQGKFWEWHDRVFSGRGIDELTLDRYVAELELDRERVARELDELAYAPAVRADLRAAKRLGLRSTPVFFINGRMLAGARSKGVFSHMVEQELDLAAGLAEQGVAAAELYDYATQWGYTAIEYTDARPELDEDSVYPVPVGSSRVRGPADAPITIVAFSDFQCPFCARGHATMEELRARYGDEVRFVFKHFPLPGHPLGALASRASFAATSDEQFWAFHDAVFATGARYEAQDLLRIGRELGMDQVALEEAMLGEQNDATIEADLELGEALGLTGTPAYFINGRPIVGAVPLLDFRMLIAEELARVEEAKAQGVAAGDIYRHLTGAED